MHSTSPFYLNGPTKKAGPSSLTEVDLLAVALALHQMPMQKLNQMPGQRLQKVMPGQALGQAMPKAKVLAS